MGENNNIDTYNNIEESSGDNNTDMENNASGLIGLSRDNNKDVEDNISVSGRFDRDNNTDTKDNANGLIGSSESVRIIIQVQRIIQVG